jgi:hypothetical protein
MRKLLFVSPHPYLNSTDANLCYNILKNVHDVYVILYAIIPKNSIFIKDRLIEKENIHVYNGDESISTLKHCISLSTPDSIIFINNVRNCVLCIEESEFYKCKKFAIVNAYYNNINSNYLKYLKVSCHKIYTCDNLEIGYNLKKYSKTDACKKLQMNENITYILNLSKNKCLRKRFDIFIKSVVLFWKTNKPENVKFIIATELQGTFNLVEIFNYECIKQKVEIEFMDVFVVVKNPHLIDEDITSMLYSISSIGINTNDGEGWGLWNLNHITHGAPQIVPNFSCFRKFCTDDNSILIDTSWSYYNDNIEGGEANVMNPVNVADALKMYIYDSSTYDNHSQNALCDNVTCSWSKTTDQILHDVSSNE